MQIQTTTQHNFNNQYAIVAGGAHYAVAFGPIYKGNQNEAS
jgi:hypothetical protein